jgi:PAS domain S-box-containing protein
MQFNPPHVDAAFPAKLDANLDQREQRVVIATPLDQDRALICEVLQQAGLATHPCASAEELFLAIEQGAATAVVAEELLPGTADRARLSTVLARQPPWSDFPILLLVARNHRPSVTWQLLSQFGDSIYITFLERPLHTATLVSSVRSAWKSRRRQYQVRDELSARLRAQAEVREREQRFRVMADNLPLLVWIHDAGGQLQFVNQTYCDFFGVARDLMRDDQWIHLLHPEDASGYVSEFTLCASEQRPFHARIRCRRGDGTWRWLESWGHPYYSEHGEYLGQVGATADITDRKRAEEAVELLNATLEQEVADRTATLATLRDIASMANETIDIEQAMVNTLRKVGQHGGWCCGRSWLPLRENASVLVVACSWQSEKSLFSFPQQEGECSVRLDCSHSMVARVFLTGCAEIDCKIDKDHNPIYPSPGSSGDAAANCHNVSAFPITSAEKVVGVIEFLAERDVAPSLELCDAMTSVGALLGRMVERETARQLLSESEQQLEAILDAVPDAVIAVDRGGTITRINSAAERIFGYSSQEMLGKGINLLMPSPYREEHAQYIARYLATGEAKIIGIGRELSGKCSKGRIFPIDLAVSEIANQKGFVGSIRDISDRKELERQVINASATEQRRIGQDIHDGVGQELTGLRYVAQTHLDALLQEDSPHAKTAQRMKEWLGTIQQQLRTIIRQLIPVEVDEQGLVAALDGLAKQTADTHGLDCCLECPEAITVPDAALATHLFRIAQEAIRNAVRHAHASQIRVRLTQASGVLRLEIADDGTGMQSSTNPAQEPPRVGVGLRSMAYRAGLIRAALDICSGKDTGTRIVCTVSQEDSLPY